MASEHIPEDLLLIMQSYVDPITPSTPTAGPSTLAKQPPKVPAQLADDEWSEGEDVVEATLIIDSDEEDAPKGSNTAESKPTLPTNNLPDSGSDSDSDSDSSTSSSDVEMRVKQYPSSNSKQDALTVLMKAPDSDVEDEDGAPQGVSNQYSGTKNEILVPDVEALDITEVPVDDVLEPIGEIMTIIDNVVVVKGNTTGVHRALDTDSLLVFEDRKVLGKVFETFGAVKQPLYSVRFSSASAIDKNTVWGGRPVSHVPARSNFVFTQAIARFKGSDASNLHDEEVGEDQLDFSDDEAEARWRRNRKEARREQASSYNPNRSPTQDTTPAPPNREQPPSILQYPPTGDDGDVPYSTLPYDDVLDSRPAPAAYDPYVDHEEDSKPAIPLPPRPEPSGSYQNRYDDGRTQARVNAVAQAGEGIIEGVGEAVDNLMVKDTTAAGQYYSNQYGQDEGYNPMNSGTGFYDSEPAAPGTMPHINPRFFSGDMTGDMSGFAMQWGDMSNMTGYGYGYPQSGFGYDGFGQGDQMGYNNPGYRWPSNEQYGQQDQSRGPQNGS
ncbi:Gar1/Naf1 RNA-binding region protein [Ceratobasidium sp. AG-Ba]|nr:Gar1/Naf1 RNA-binding region protein [Ceratobasidium sp. AG-Ba]